MATMHFVVMLLLFYSLQHAAVVLAHPSRSTILPQIGTGPTKKRSVAKRDNAGIGIGLAIAIILLLVLAFELGKRFERHGSWRGWRTGQGQGQGQKQQAENAQASSTDEQVSQVQGSKQQVNGANKLLSPAPAELQSGHRRPRHLELPSKEVYEMGPPTPREMGLPTPRENWPRRSWIHMAWRRNRQSVYHTAENSSWQARRPTSTLSLPAVSHLNPKPARNEDGGRKDTRSVLVDWHGNEFEHIRPLYGEKKQVWC